MTVYLTIEEIIVAHEAVIADTGGAPGLRSREALEAAVATPHMTFGGVDDTWA